MPVSQTPGTVPARIHFRALPTLRLASGLALAAMVQSAPSGDILRGGAAAPGVTNRTPGASTGAAQAAAARSTAQDALARTSRVVEAVQRAQMNANRAAAGANNAGADPNHPGLQLPDVPNGLGPGGLQVAPGVGTDLSLWTGAFLPTQSQSGARTLVNIKQTQSQAVLNWETFNIGRDTQLNFDQSDGKENTGQWIAFNKVNDPSGRPSQILGSITAPGQVYVVNQNGIIFGGASQVNVHTLVASSLPINDALIRDGLLNQQTSAQFLFSALAQAGTTPFVPPPLPATGRIGDVTVLPGAVLTAPSNESKVGGRIALVGPNVNNAGTILTPDGQTILAAGLQVGFAAHSSADPSLRGLDVFIGAVADPASAIAPYAGTASNNGSILANRGSVSVAGKNVRQMGVIDATTSVALNGRIDLMAEFDAINNTSYDPVTRPNVAPFLYGNGPSGTSTGTVTMGPGSVTRILPEWGSEEKVVGTELALKSQVNARGSILHMDRGAMVHAPGGIVNFAAGSWDYATMISPPVFVRAGGQIYLGEDAMINVAGTPDAASPLSNHILTVALRSAELASSPLQRTGLLRGPEITVDLRRTGTYNGREWVGTPLADLRGYLNVIQRTVDELTVGGGTVNLNSGGSIIIQKNASIDVSAGWLNYGGGFVRTSRLLYNGNLIDIASATPDRVYDGIFSGLFTDSHPRWNIERTYRIPWMDGEHYEAGYLQGANAGRLALAGASMALDGIFRGSAVSGLRQTTTPAKGGSLKLDYEIERLIAGASTGIGTAFSPTPPDITFTDNPGQRPAGAFGVDEAGLPLPLREDRVERAMLPAGWLGENGFASLEIVNPDGDIVVPSGVALNAPASGSIALSGANVSILGSLKAPGGAINVNVFKLPPSLVASLKASGAINIPVPEEDRGRFILGGGAVVDTAGLIVDNRPASPTLSQSPRVLDGGTISIKAWSADLAPGSLMDVSGGVEFGPRGERTFGKAGKLEIIAGQDPNLAAVDGGTLRLGGLLKGFSGTTTGGTLSLQAQLIQIGGSPLSPASLSLSPDFFNQGGFSTFNLTGLGQTVEDEEYLPGIYIAPGTRIAPKVLGYVAMPYGGPGGTIALVPYQKPEGLRAPANLSFTAKGVRNELSNLLLTRGDVVVGRGASLLTDALGSLSFRGDTVSFEGSATAPGGRISIVGANSLPQVGAPPEFAQTTVYLGPTARLSTAGTSLTQRDRFGRMVGSVLPGGSISVSGNIVAESGALLDVSGTSGMVDLHPHQLGLGADGRMLKPGDQLVPATSGLTSPLYQGLSIRTNLDSNGGSITLTGGQMLFSDAELRGKAGGESALGGTLSVTSGRFQAANSAETNLVVTQGGLVIPPGWNRGQSPIGQPVRDASGTPLAGMGYFAADRFASGGFDSLVLGGNVEFRGPVRITADRALRVAGGGVIRADSRVELTADYLSLGQAFVPPLRAEDRQLLFTLTNGTEYFLTPSAGTGELVARANLIDVGTLSLQGIGRTTLNAGGGAIRGNGTLNAAGRLELVAGQIYPTTASRFNIVVYDAPGSPGTLVVGGGNGSPLPLSAGGELNLFANTIVQGGVLRAPFGTIRLGWDGTGTAPFADPLTGTLATLPVTQQLTLTAGSETSVSGVDPRTGLGITIPYGYVSGGEAWIDPTGVDITATGPPERKILIGARNLSTEAGSLIDIRGGGDLYAYRWVEGNGGPDDVLLNNGSYAILPGYDSTYDPYAPFNTRTDAFGDDPGYINSTLNVGDQIYLARNGRVPAGNYTLLPARYALQPGGFLVTPLSGGPIGSFQLPDGSSLVSGYRFNTTNFGTGSSVQSRFELAPGSVVRQRAAYEDFFANTFFKEAAAALKTGVPRLPEDSGRLVLQAVESMLLNGTVAAKSMAAGRGGLVDISSAADIYIGAGLQASAPAGSLLLRAEQLNAMGAESLLIGGVRTYSAAGANVAVNTGKLILDNGATALSGTDIILTSKTALTLAPGASLVSTGSVEGGLDPLIFGNTTTAGSGNGLMVRMAADPAATSTRLGVTPGGAPLLTVGAGVRMEGESLTLDSTSGTSLSPDAALLADTIHLFSGQISLVRSGPGPVPAGTGLVLSGGALTTLEQRARDLDLRSYTSLDLYGSGTVGVAGSLRLSAGQIRGFGQDGGEFGFRAPTIVLDNQGNATVPGIVSPATGNLVLSGNTIMLGAGDLRIDQFNMLRLDAASGLIVSGRGSLTAQNDVRGSMPVVTGMSGASHALRAGGILDLAVAPGVGVAPGGLGAEIALQGSSVNLGTSVVMPSGRISVKALTGNIEVGGLLSATGTARAFNDAVRYTDAGEVLLTSDSGTVNLLPGSLVDVSAQAGGGNAGLFSASAPMGSVVLGGSLRGQAGAGGLSGSAFLDVNAGTGLTDLNDKLDAGGFFESRQFRVRSGNVVLDGTSRAHSFRLAADAGSITVRGTIDASGTTGGLIALTANGSLTLQPSARLTVAAADFDSAGKGGSISLQSGSSRNGVVPSGTLLDLQAGSVLDLSVASFVPGGIGTPGSSAFYGKFGGTLHLRAPRSAGNDGLGMGPLASTITGASSILAEGYELTDLTASGTAGTITTAVQTGINTRATAFMTHESAIVSGLLGSDSQGLGSLLVLAPGAEIINRAGNLTLGTATSTNTTDWSLHAFRYGAKAAPGVLTLRAPGDLIFFNALSDGFTPATSGNAGQRLWQGTAMNINPLLPVNTQSWSYHLTAGADLSAADGGAVLSATALAPDRGSLLLGKNYNAVLVAGATAQTATAVQDRFQVIRTGTGDITINAGRDIRLLNQFASIYTAGAALANPESIFNPNDFSIPLLNGNGIQPQTPELGSSQTVYNPSWTMAGGNVSLQAGQNIGRYTLVGGVLTVDTSRQIPNNWLMRRGALNPETGEYGFSGITDTGFEFADPSSSTTWWVDFSNFFQGIGTLGGGNIRMTAGNDIINTDAVAPTNARAAGLAADGSALAPDSSKFVELGGGDIRVQAGRNIDGGTYYVERGNATLSAGAAVTTNQARSPSLGILGTTSIPVSQNDLIVSRNPEIYHPLTWMPTNFYLGKGSISVNARQDILMGPVANTFLLPQGLNNKIWYKTYFSTYGADSSLDVVSLGGNITHRNAVSLPQSQTATPTLIAWLSRQNLFDNRISPTTRGSNAQPWIRLVETGVSEFGPAASLLPPILRSTAFGGEINIVGNVTLSPSAGGTVELLADGAINGIGPTGRIRSGNLSVNAYTSGQINLSDADPALIPGILSPYAGNVVSGASVLQQRRTNLPGGLPIDGLLDETGSYTGTAAAISRKRALHSAGLLHLADRSPTLIYSGADISGLTIFSAKAARIIAGRDMADVSLYLQNIAASDISLVSAGRDLIPFNESAALRSKASDAAQGNLLLGSQRPTSDGGSTNANAGDIQINGPGVLEVLAGGKIDLGVGANFTDGTGTGIASIGNFRNPFLPGTGADLIVMAGVGGADGAGAALGLSRSSLDIEAFTAQYAATGSTAESAYLKKLGASSSGELTDEQKAIVALEVFFDVLKKSGRDAALTGSYADGYAAIDLLYGTAGTGEANILGRSRDIRTSSGGAISIAAPGGGLSMASQIFGNPLAPPGIVTETGGSVSIFTNDSVSLGQARIFTLRGGNITIWSSTGDIAAGSAAKTVVSAPPTRVLIDSNSADVRTDLAGLATGGGIGVLATVDGVAPGDVDLIAPVGAVDAGDAGIRSSGNLTIAASQVLNAGNIAVAGSSAGTPAAAPVAPAVSTPAPAPPPTASKNQASDAAQAASAANQQKGPAEVPVSDVTVEVLGYGGGESEPETAPLPESADEEEKRRRRQQQEAQEQTNDSPPAASSEPAPSAAPPSNP
ncbi:MAG: hypothetical protein JWL81_577 [Verrucomicrobiales bacterium]|nr:hypothetical protein [Verrucomicrobiales bacterium]